MTEVPNLAYLASTRAVSPVVQTRNCLMKNDVQIQQDVVAELDRERNIITGTIGVEVHHGVVKLAGQVGDDSIRDKSEVAAQRVDGVTSVVMDIDVPGTGTATSAAL
jgi:osmotically-inducible protein OsmY